MLEPRSLKPLVHRGFRALDRIPGMGRLASYFRHPPRSEVELSIVMPMHPKDFWIAPLALDCARRNIMHTIREVFVVGQDTVDLRAFCKQHDCIFIDESRLIDLTLGDVAEHLARFGVERPSWIFQQLLKLAIDSFVETESFVILDADTLLLQPKIFCSNGILYQDYSHERNPLYLRSYERLIGPNTTGRHSYVCHYMYGEKRILHDLKSTIEKNTGQSWGYAIVDMADPSNWTAEERASYPFNFFSEYETYVNFAKCYYREVKEAYFLNCGADDFRPGVDDPRAYVRKLPFIYRSVSFHSYYYHKDPAHRDQARRS